MKIEKSDRKGKRLVAIFPDGTRTHFGLEGGSTYVDHGDKVKRNNYIKRHRSANQDWSNPKTAGALSRYILWGNSTSMDKNISEFRKRFGL